MPAPEYLEPAVRDPKKLRRTAWWLVAIAATGGWFVMKAYEKWTIGQAGDERPSIVHRIQPERSLRVIRQDGKQADLIDLRSEVFVLHVMHTGQPESSAHSLAVMKRLAEHYAGTKDFHLLSLVINPGDAAGLLDKLRQVADDVGAELPQWWIASNEPATLQTFIRKELKPSMPPEEVDGRWEFDASIVLVDRNGHLRRAVVPQQQGGPPYIANFDFDQAAQWDADGKMTGTELSNQEQLEALLIKTIDKLLAEPFKP